MKTRLIVIIEDNPQSARLAARLLKKAGYETIIANDGELGLAAVLEHNPDLVLVDLGLPDIDGQTIVGLIRENTENERLSIVIFTAWLPEHVEVMARTYNCDGVITKPIDTRKFAEQVTSFLKNPA